MLFSEMNGGLGQDRFLLKAVTIGEDGYTIDDVLTHDALPVQLPPSAACYGGRRESLPLAIGVIRDVEAPVYEEEVDKQTHNVEERKHFGSLRDSYGW